MPELTSSRSCGACSLCCTVLRVDVLSKLGGVACVHQDVDGPGCAIHVERPAICRAYRCLWLKGGLEQRDRPDAFGAVLDIVSTGPTVQLEIRQARPGAFAASPRLLEIAEEYRRTMPVRISDVADVMNPDAPYEIRLPSGARRLAIVTCIKGTRAGSRRRIGQTSFRNEENL